MTDGLRVEESFIASSSSKYTSQLKKAPCSSSVVPKPVVPEADTTTAESEPSTSPSSLSPSSSTTTSTGPNPESERKEENKDLENINRSDSRVSGLLKTRCLDWTNFTEEELKAYHQPDMVVTCDTAYLKDLHKPLGKTLLCTLILYVI